MNFGATGTAAEAGGRWMDPRLSPVLSNDRRDIMRAMDILYVVYFADWKAAEGFLEASSDFYHKARYITHPSVRQSFWFFFSK